MINCLWAVVAYPISGKKREAVAGSLRRVVGKGRTEAVAAPSPGRHHASCSGSALIFADLQEKFNQSSFIMAQNKYDID
jgi:hypothetical protein